MISNLLVAAKHLTHFYLSLLDKHESTGYPIRNPVSGIRYPAPKIFHYPVIRYPAKIQYPTTFMNDHLRTLNNHLVTQDGHLMPVNCHFWPLNSLYGTWIATLGHYMLTWVLWRPRYSYLVLWSLWMAHWDCLGPLDGHLGPLDSHYGLQVGHSGWPFFRAIG